MGVVRVLPLHRGAVRLAKPRVSAPLRGRRPPSPLALIALARLDSRSNGRSWSFARDWVPAVLVLVAYRSIDWVPTPLGDRAVRGRADCLDGRCLNDWGLRAAAEQFGALIPGMLELAYLTLYAILPLIIASFSLATNGIGLTIFSSHFCWGRWQRTRCCRTFRWKVPLRLHGPRSPECRHRVPANERLDSRSL